RLPSGFPDAQEKFAMIAGKPCSVLCGNCRGKAHEKSTSAIRKRRMVVQKNFEALTSKRSELRWLPCQPVQNISREKRICENLQRGFRRFVEKTKSCNLPLDLSIRVKR